MKKITRKGITAGLAAVALGGALVAGGTAIATGGDDSSAAARGVSLPATKVVADDHGRRHGGHGADDVGFDDRGGRGASPRPAAAAQVDVPGPCDEAEHANDPRCTGAAVTRAGDDGVHRHRGRGSDDVGFDDRGGRGSDDVGFDDRGGHGSDDVGFDDHGGHGRD